MGKTNCNGKRIHLNTFLTFKFSRLAYTYIHINDSIYVSNTFR